MFKRVPFIKPQVQNSFQKTERNYPEQVSFDEMEEERSVSKAKKLNQTFQSNIKPMAIIGNDNAIQRFFFIRSDVWNPDPNTQPEPETIWSIALTKILPNEKKKILVFRQQEYIIAGFTGTGYPQVIYICAPLMSGYLDENFASTDRVAALVLTDLNPVIDDASTKTYDLRYELKESVSWEIPPSMTNLTFKIRFDEETTYAELPLFNPITFDFEIRRA